MSSERRTPDLSEQQVNSLLRSYLREEWHEDANRVASSVLDELDSTPQRRSGWTAWRSLFMNNNIVRVGLAAAAVVVIAIIAINLLPGTNPPGGGPSPSPSVEPSDAASSTAPSEAAASIPPETALSEGPFVLWDPAAPVQPNWLDPEFDDGPPITVTIPTGGWVFTDSFNLLKGNEVNNLAESKFTWTSTTHGVLVYGDPCQWASTTPDAPATTADAIAAALAAQPSRDASDPVELTIGGYPAQRITLHVPNDAVFTDCDGGQFASFTLDGFEGGPWRAHDGPSQIDTLWIVDVDGAIVILDGMYRPDTSAERIEEMRSIAESATFELP
jgi:hypothetical protein